MIRQDSHLTSLAEVAWKQLVWQPRMLVAAYWARKLEIFLNKADVGSTIARAWLDNDGVDVIADVLNSSVALAVQDIARQHLA